MIADNENYAAAAHRRSCAYCVYFDALGRANVLAARLGKLVHGDCLNNHSSPVFTTSSSDTCAGFYDEADAESAAMGAF